MQTAELDPAFKVWPRLAEVVYVPHSEEQYCSLVAVLDRLIDEVGEDESHPLASLMEVVGALVEKYEEEHVAELDDTSEMNPSIVQGAGGAE